MKIESFDELLREIEKDHVASSAAHENKLRRRLGFVFDSERKRKGLSIRDFAISIGTSLSQVQRLLHERQGGSLTLRTIIRAAESLDMEIVLNASPKCRLENVLPRSGYQEGWKSMTAMRWERRPLVRGDKKTPEIREDMKWTTTDASASGSTVS